MTALDADFVRSQFPAFAEASLQGHAFFENAGGSYTCGQVTRCELATTHPDTLDWPGNRRLSRRKADG